MSASADGRRTLRYSRRELIEMVFGTSTAAAILGLGGGCQSWESLVSGRLPPQGELFSPNHKVGHRLREAASTRVLPRSKDSSPSSVSTSSPVSKHRCVVIGAGVSGLSAAWHLRANGIEDFVVLELETVAGGTSRGGDCDGFSFPWGAHYLPVPMADNRPLVDFLNQCGVLTRTPQGGVEVAEQVLCRDPEERVFADGRWSGGLYPEAVATPGDRAQLTRFRAEMSRLGNSRDDEGRRWFAIPMSESSPDKQVRALDQISMSDWMQEHGFDSSLLKWLVDYACRDDYGLHPDQTSAWAGLFYFAARIADETGESQSVMTWPQGNGFLVEKMIEPLGDRLRLGAAVMKITPTDAAADRSSLRIDVLDCQTGMLSGIEAEHVIVAIPRFIASRVLDSELFERGNASTAVSPDIFSYGSWLVANVHLNDRPGESGFPMAWDNVMLSSGSLGYVNSTHQTGRDHGATVLTWYQALPSDSPPEVRNQLMNLSWAEATEAVIVDLEIAHPEIRSLIERLDVMVWGHAMPQPRVGSLFHRDRQSAEKPIGNVHFASTDLSGLALFEEAFHHGHRAAQEVTEGVRSGC